MSRILYGKSSNERAPRFALHTQMLEGEGGNLCFQKFPDTPEAMAHVRRIAECREKLECFYDSGELLINACVLTDQGIELEYLAGPTLEEEIDRTFAEKGAEEAGKLIDRFFALTQPEGRLQPFQMTEGFQAIFGTGLQGQVPDELQRHMMAGLPAFTLDNLPSLPVADLDMIFPNIILDEKGWNLIDYEWTVFFPVPAEFLRYRALHYFTAASSRRDWAWKQARDRWQIDPDRIPLWENMEKRFQAYIMGEYTPLQELYVQMSPGVTDLSDLEEHDRRFRQDAIRVYWSTDGEFSEEQTLVCPFSEGWNTLRIRLPEGTRKIRLDPGERSAICALRKWQIDGASARIAAHNGARLSDQVWAFPLDDPQWTTETSETGMRETEIEIEIQQMNPDLLQSFAEKTGREKSAGLGRFFRKRQL